MATFLGIIAFLSWIFFIVVLIVKPLRRKLFGEKKPMLKTCMYGTISFVVFIAAMASTDTEAKTAPVAETVSADVKTDSAVKLTDEDKKKAKEEANAKAKADKEAKAKADAEAKAAAEAAKMAKIGDALKVGDVVFQVNGMTVKKSVGSDFLTQDAVGTFLILDITVKNEGKEAITSDTSFFKLMQGDIEYEADVAADFYVNGDKTLFYQKINPGLAYTAKVVYDVSPEVAKSGELALNVQTGIWGSEQGKIALK